ncbi:MAG: (cytosine-5-)-methyltransferase [Burkholderiaceae bacterium]|nr:(cytosine-5-)-methyltransferase [Burkholderiaceae bacterium]
MRAIDLFAGAGGFSVGAEMADCNIVWAANHWLEAVEVHSKNHPTSKHACQDLQQARWEDVPAHDLLLASPCCQGHSKARGRANGNPQHDASRSTAWAVVAAAEHHRPAAAIIENVPEFIRWSLYPAWRMAMESLGYCLAPHIIDAADHGVPQHRERLFIIATRSQHPLMLNFEHQERVPASKIINFGGGNWTPINRSGRSQNTLRRIAAGRTAHGNRFLTAYYGNERGGRSLDRPIGTITTRDRWAVIDGDHMRMLTANECRAAMGFPENYQLPRQHRLAVHMLGNAVCPPVARDVINALKEAA